jgi:hypothetical protein
MRDIDAVDVRCGHNVEKGEASTAHRLLRTASGAAFYRRQIVQVEDAPAAGRVADSINRKPRPSAGVDLMHTVIALSTRNGERDETPDNA